MAVTSTTLAGINVWRFSGAVTDVEIQTAWGSLIVNGRYVPGRYIYLDATCDLRSVRGAVYVDVQAFGFILHSSRNAANATLKNWFVAQTVGLSVPNRFNLVRATDGTTVVNTTTDGLDMYRGALIYGVAGNPGGADPRFLCIPSLGNIDGTSLVSQNFTEQQMQPATRRAGVWRGIEMQRVTTFGLIQAQINVVWYRCNGNTENVGSAQTSGVISPQENASICYVSNTLRKANLPVTGTLADTYRSTGLTTIMFLNNWKDETWFGVSKTSIEAANWNAGNRFVGGVLKKIQVQPETLVRVYDSRSTTASQKSTFSETTADFLSGTNSTTADAVTGRATIVVTGAIATGAGPNVPITRYTGQQFTLQKFGWRVQSQSVDMSTGDDDLSAFAPIIMTAQTGIVRTEAAINAATTVDTLQQLLEQLHVLAIGLVGSASYSGTYDGNLFTYAGGTLTTSFSSVTVDASAASKIAYNSATNALTIRSSVLASNSTVTQWVNASGSIGVANGAVLNCLYTTNAGPSAKLTLQNLINASFRVSTNSGTQYDFGAGFTGTKLEYFVPALTDPYVWIVERLGYNRQTASFNPSLGGDTLASITWIPDTALVVTNAATLAAYTSLNTPNMVLDYVAYWRTTSAGIIVNKVSKNGSACDFGNANIVFSSTASAPLDYNSGTNTFTIKTSTHTAGSSLTSYVTTGAVTVGSGVAMGCTYTDSAGAHIKVISADGLPLSTYIKQNTTDLGWLAVSLERPLVVQPSDTVVVYVTAYGYKARLITYTGAELIANSQITLIPESFIETSLNTATRDLIAASFSAGVDAYSRVYLNIGMDLRGYSPAEVINGAQYYLVNSGYLVAAAALASGTANALELNSGGATINSAGFYAKVNDSITDAGDLGIYMPLYLYVNPAVYLVDPTYTPVKKNSAGVVLGVALWTKSSATVTEQDKDSIVAKLDASTVLAKKSDVQVVNNGVKKASLLIPHTQNVP